MQNLKRCLFVSDNDGHNYVIPFELKDDFNRLLEKSEDEDDWEEFGDMFDEYQIGGCPSIVEIYTDFSNLKMMRFTKDLMTQDEFISKGHNINKKI